MASMAAHMRSPADIMSVAMHALVVVHSVVVVRSVAMAVHLQRMRVVDTEAADMRAVTVAVDHWE
ncbi:hypothetical protein [Candidatus Binatus soli]|uniref:hypothetical protein n=1 Tax=Candidatus Binatus soli TaxID=1953413 RepID=UPI003D144033